MQDGAAHVVLDEVGVERDRGFDTQVPHWFGSTGDEPAEILSIYGRPGERMHVRIEPDDRSTNVL